MEEALKKVTVSEGVRDALVGHTGALAPVLELIVQYELANSQKLLYALHGLFIPVLRILLRPPGLGKIQRILL